MQTRTRLIIFLLTFFVLSGVLGYASTTSLSKSDAASLSQGLQGITENTLGIFKNNVLIALGEFVPLFGPGLGIYSSYDTGLVLAALAQSNPSAGITGFESFIILLLTPIFWLEFFRYSLAVEESVSVIVSFRNKDFRTREWKWLVGSVGLVVVTLFVSAQLEVSLINFLS